MSATLEIERFEALINAFVSEMEKSIHDAGGDPDYFSGHAERMIDDMKLCFFVAEDNRQRDREDVGFRPRVPYSTLNPTTQGLTSPLARV